MMRAFIVAALCALSLPAAAQAPAPTTLVPKGTPTFDERFTSFDAGPDLTAKAKPPHRWRTIDKANTPTEANCCMFGNATRVSDGAFKLTPYYLSITATKAKDGTWSSGYASTKFSFAQLRGYFEFDANVPVCTKGAWPALWLLPTTGTWPAGGEIDVLEAIGDGVLYQSIHTKETGKHTGDGAKTKASCARGWHTYGVLWRKETISFYVDRRLTGTFPTPADFDKPMYLIVNLAMGGSWAGTPTVTREQMFVRRVTAWADQ